MKRRSFFRFIASAVAVVALAPEIAFGRKLEGPQAPPDYNKWAETPPAEVDWKKMPFWTETRGYCYYSDDYMKFMAAALKSNPDAAALFGKA